MRSALSRTIVDYRQSHGPAALVAEFAAVALVAFALMIAAGVCALLGPIG